MKNLVLAVQILIFVFMQIAPSYLHADNSPSIKSGSASTEASVAALKTVPKNYRLPDMTLVKGAASAISNPIEFYNRYHTKKGDTVDVEGVIGRFGATWGADFKQQIYMIEQQYNSKVSIILSLDTTMADAKILQEKMKARGNENVVIVEIPSWLQNQILESVTAAAAKKEQQGFIFQTKTVGKSFKPQTFKGKLKTAGQIIANQYVTPTKEEIKVAAISAAAAGTVTATALLFSVGLSDLTLLSLMNIIGMTLLKSAVVGTVGSFGRTLGNLAKADLSNELKIASGIKATLGEVFYAIGANGMASFGSYNISSAIADSMSAMADKKANDTKEEKLSDKAKKNIFWYTFALGTALGLLGAIGIGDSLILDQSIIKITKMQAATFGITLGLAFLYKFHANRVEALADKDLIERTKLSMNKIVSLQTKFKTNPNFQTLRPVVTLMGDNMTCGALFN